RLDHENGPVRHVIGFEDAVLLTDDGQFPVASQSDALAGVINDRCDALELDRAGFFGLDLAFFDHPTGRATDVEGAHGQLRARLADRLGGNDADGHAFFHQVACRQVHAVAQAAHSEGRLAGHRAAHENLVHAQGLDLAGHVPGDHLVLADDDFAGDGGNGVAADPAANRLAQGAFDLFALVDNAFGDALGSAAVVHGDDDVLSHVG